MTDELTIALPFRPDVQGNTLGEKALRVPAEMILQIASGLDEPAEIAARYGFTTEEFTTLSAWTPFQQEVAKCRAELEKSGFNFVLDARLKAKELSDIMFVRAMGQDATFNQVHDAFRTFTEFGDLKPKPAPPPGAGAGPNSGFSINIVLSTDPRTQRDPNGKPVIDVTPGHPNPHIHHFSVDVPPVEVMGTHNPFHIDTTPDPT